MITPAAAEVMFEAWGKWCRGSHSLLYGSMYSEGGAFDGDMPKSVEAVEGCVLVMPKPLSRVCKHRYIGQEPAYIVMKKLKCGETTYNNRINQAIHFLIDYLTET